MLILMQVKGDILTAAFNMELLMMRNQEDMREIFLFV